MVNLVPDLPGEFDVVKEAVLNGGLAVHLIDLLVGEAIPHRRKQLAEAVLVDHTLE
jgi:hypothetical protein